jgi:phage baseplate assembly protein W
MSNEMINNYMSTQLSYLGPQIARSSASPAYGADLYCVTDLLPTMRMVTGDSVEIIQQSLIRRLNSPRGSLYSDQDYGMDLKSYLNTALTTAGITEMQDSIQAECRKDDRVESCVATVALNGLDALSVSARVSPVDPLLDDFDLTFSLTSDTLELL